jgi:radical SAM/Cys-rich protein
MSFMGNNMACSSRFTEWLAEVKPDVEPKCIDTLWLNITTRCNQSCRHCHVVGSREAGDQMGHGILSACLELLRREPGITTVDITGGAPELNPLFESLVSALSEMGKRIVVRHNLTVTLDGDSVGGRSLAHLPGFFAAHRVEILASLPSCQPTVTDAIRGRRVFAKSIESLKRLRDAGYGRIPGLVLKLVTNQEGPISVARRLALENEYRQTLNHYGIEFNELLSITNMPVGRQSAYLHSSGRLEEYLDTLAEAASPDTTTAAVCRHTISIGPDGKLYDCDFNQALRMTLDEPAPQTIFDFDYEALCRRKIRFADHCFGCAAGAGSG